MIFKRKFLMLMLLIFMIFAVGHVSATDNVTDGAEDVLGADESVINDNLSHDISDDNLQENMDENVILEFQDKDSIANSQNSEISVSSDNQKDKLSAYEDYGDYYRSYSKVKMDPVTRQYNSGYLKYTANVWDYRDYGYDLIKHPAANIVKLKVFTGKKSKTYAEYTNDNAKVTFKIPKLSVGYHKVQLYYGGKLKKTSHIKIIKSNTKIKAPAVSAYYKKSNFFKIAVKDHYNNPVRYSKIKLSVNGKTYIVHTNKKGIAKFNTKRLPIGKHKVVLKSANKKYKIKKTSRIVIKKFYRSAILWLTVDDTYYAEARLKTGDILLGACNSYTRQHLKGITIGTMIDAGQEGQHSTTILKAKVYFENDYTGKVITRTTTSTSRGYNVHLNWIDGWTPYKAQVWYKHR